MLLSRNKMQIMEITISQEAYDNYIKFSRSNHPQHIRLRPENEDFLDTLLVDMEDTSRNT